jgi:hypothetical protein
MVRGLIYEFIKLAGPGVSIRMDWQMYFERIKEKE